MKRCVILGAAHVENYGFLKTMIKPKDYVVCADGGFRHAQKIGITPDLFVGDFDSIPKTEVQSVKMMEHPSEKDYTDLMLAVKEGLARSCDSFLIFGALGGRLDHTLANITIVSYLCDLGIECWIVDEKNMALMIKNTSITIPNRNKCKFSVLAWGGTAKGISIRSAKYNVENLIISCSDPRGISNEFVQKDVTISVREGKLLIILSKD